MSRLFTFLHHLRRMAVVSGSAAVIAVTAGAVMPALAQSQMGASGLPLPRFVSLGASRINLRVGPGTNYAVDWMYLKSGLPVEIIQEYDNWRRVRDSDGAEGWINQSLLSGQRTAIVAPWQKGKAVEVMLRREANHSANPVAILEPGVVGSIKSCNGKWCEMSFAGHDGWIDQSQIWGAYPGESYED